MDVKVQNEPWCEMCPFVDLIVNREPVYMDNELVRVGLTAQCCHLDQCRAAVKRAKDLEEKALAKAWEMMGWPTAILQSKGTAPKWISVDDSLPEPGELVLCAMEKDGVWFPKWGYHVDGRWRVIIQPGSIGEIPIERLSRWIRLAPPTPMVEAAKAAMKEAGV